MNILTIMRRVLSSALAMVLALGLLNQPALADGDGASRIREKIAAVPVGSEIMVRLKDHREFHGRLADRQEQSFQLETPDAVSVAYRDVKSVKRTDSVPPMGNSAFNRRVTIGIIVIGAIIGIAIWAASQLK